MKDKITWEVNFWALLEGRYGLKVDFYPGDHNNSIIEIPCKFLSVVASLTTIPSRIDSECKLTLLSLIPQVEKIYLNVSTEYEKYGVLTVPDYFAVEPFKSKVKVNFTKDEGPITKYIGALDKISMDRWIFFCDDDQEYHPTLIARMLNDVQPFTRIVYQNMLNYILIGTSGGAIHGFVGNLAHRSVLEKLIEFPRPDAAKFVDDQIMSIYYSHAKIFIKGNSVQLFPEIYAVLDQGREKIGSNALINQTDRGAKIREVCDFYHVKFNGVYIETIE